MRAFDELFASGVATQGDNQNGKGDFFNDLLAVLLENCSGKLLHSRPDVPGYSFTTHKLDLAYPAAGKVLLTIETKATGAPKNPRNPKQKHLGGRAGSADLDKRIKEASFKNVDMKAAAAQEEGLGGGPTSDLRAFLRHGRPHSYLFLSVRVRDEADLKKSIQFARIAAMWFEECGLYCYGWNPEHSSYEPKLVPREIRMDVVLSGICTTLRNLP
jgi:hypothetical protein